ncbi:hypothetical protein D1872_90160 [compost metagenome]
MNRLFHEFYCDVCESRIYSTRWYKSCPVCEQREREKEKESFADTPVSKPTEDGKVKVHMTPYRPSYWGTPDTDILNLLQLYKKDLEAKEERYKTLQEEALERYHKSKTKTLTFLELMSQADDDFKELARKWTQTAQRRSPTLLGITKP